MSFLDAIVDCAKKVFPPSSDLGSALSLVSNSSSDIKNTIQGFVSAGPQDMLAEIENNLPFSLPIDVNSSDAYIMNMSRNVLSYLPDNVGSLVSYNDYSISYLADNLASGYAAGNVGSMTDVALNTVYSSMSSSYTSNLQGIQSMINDSSSLTGDIQDLFVSGNINNITDSVLNRVVNSMSDNALNKIGKIQNYIPAYTDLLSMQDNVDSMISIGTNILVNEVKSFSDPTRWTSGQLRSNFNDMAGKFLDVGKKAMEIKFSFF